MNPVFWFLVFLGAIVLWFVLDRFFIPLGKIVLKKWNKTMGILVDKTEEKDKNECEEKENK